MSEHRAIVHWNRNGTQFRHKEYNRDHHWHFESGFVIEASAAPQYLGNEDLVDPERAFVAKTSGAILVLLTFLVAMNLAAVLLRNRFERRW